MSRQQLDLVRAKQALRAQTAITSLRANRQNLLVGAETDFRTQSVTTDEFGRTHVRFEQLYGGLPVWGGSVVTHTGANDEALRPDNHLVRGLMVRTTPGLSADQALKVASKAMPRDAWTSNPSAELVVFPHFEFSYPDKPFRQINAMDGTRKLTGASLVYHVHVESQDAAGPHSTDFLIDANKGTVLKKWSSLETVAATGTGASQYSGTVSLSTNDLGTGTFELRDVSRPAPGVSNPFATPPQQGNVVVNMSGATSGWGTVYSNSTNTWGDGANFNDGTDVYASTHGETAGVDALYGLQKTWDYYLNVLGRFGPDDQGTPVVSRVHFYNNYDNAFWSNSCFCMTYGDGSAAAFGGLNTVTALDVIGHEVSHGVMANTAGLIYYGQAGGLNEANSDINGEMVEFYTKGGGGSGTGPVNAIGDTGGDWLIGEDLGSALRVMYKPSWDGISPDAWYPGIDELDVHYSSGPMNRAFFFLAWGASNVSTDPTYSPYLPAGMFGLGNDEAARIWYYAVKNYLPWNSDYGVAREMAVAAALDLYGFPSAEYDAVQNAFAAINVGLPAGHAEDFTNPTTTISASVSGETATVTASATDDNVVREIDFYMDSLSAWPFAHVYQPQGSASFDVSDLPEGTHTVYAVAFDQNDNAGIAQQTITVGPHAYTEMLLNPGFESSPATSNWTQTSSLGGGIINDWSGLLGRTGDFGIPRSGNGVAWFNGYGQTDTDTLVSAAVAIPANAAKISLTFWLWINTSEPSPSTLDTFNSAISTNGGSSYTSLFTLSNATAGTGWIRRTFDLSTTTYAGQTVNIRFQGKENAQNTTSFLLDDVTLRVVTSPDTTPPTVVASESGSTGDIQFFADANDNMIVKNVTWTVDGTTTTPAKTTPPFVWNFDSSTLSYGTHSLVATATDTSGNVTVSAPVSFNVDNNGTLRNWGFEENTNGAPWTKAGTVSIYRSSAAHGGAQYCRMNGATYTTAPPATGSISQVVTIPAGATSVQLGYWLQVLTAYTDNLQHDQIVLHLVDASSVDHVLGTVWNNDPTWADGAYHQQLFDVSAYVGQTVTISLQSNQTSQNTITLWRVDDFSLQYTGLADTIAPTVAVSEAGSYGTIDLSANPSDNIGVTKTELYVDGNLVGTQNGPGAYDLAFDSTTLSDSSHTLLAKAYDSSGNIGTSSLTFTVANGDIVPPTVAADPVASFGTVTLSATASDNIGVVEVDFFIDGLYVGTPSASPYQLTVNSDGLSAGTHTFSAYAFDATGSYSHSDVAFTHVAPTVTVSPSTAWVGTAQTAQFTASVTNAGDTSVTWSIDEASAGGTVDASGNYLAPLTAGVFHVRATSNADPTQSAVVTVNVIVVNADINRDGKVDGDDMGLLGSAYGSSTGGPSFVANADLNGDGTIDDTDVNLFLPAFGN